MEVTNSLTLYKMRQRGYYWVRTREGHPWAMAYCEGENAWRSKTYPTDDCFFEINENRILDPEEYKYKFRDLYHELIVACGTLLNASRPDGLDHLEKEIEEILNKISLKEQNHE